MTRQKKTPRQRAQETLAAAERRVVRLENERAKAQIAVNKIKAAYTEAEARLDYARKDPALAKPATSTNNTGGTTA